MNVKMNKLILLTTLLIILTPSSHAAIIVYTDRASWQSDTGILHLPEGSRFSENFESVLPQTLSTGSNLVGNIVINITGAPGFNSIDDSLTTDPFSDALSPDGSRYYLGQTGGSTSSSLGLYEGNLGASVWAFGADWVISGDLIIEVAGTTISFADYLPSGEGFLGLYVESLIGGGGPLNNLALLAADGSASFGMDNAQYLTQGPIPPAVWLFGSGLIGLIGVARRKA